MATEEFTGAIALLKADRRKVEELFEKFAKASGGDAKQKPAHQICTELKIHTSIEEEIFYPALRGEIEAASPDADFYDAKVTVLSEEIKHHVREEEAPGEGMFAQARKTDVDLVELRDRMLARKQELTAQAKSSGLPIAKPRAVNLVTA